MGPHRAIQRHRTDFHPLTEWERRIAALGGKIQKQASGELFTTYWIQRRP